MNWKQNNRVAVLTMGELADRITQAVSKELGYGRDIGFAGVPMDSYRAGLHWDESCAIRREVEKYIPKKSLEQMGLKYDYVTINSDSGTTVQIRLYLRKSHPLYHKDCRPYRQGYTVDLFTLHRSKARNNQGQILAFKELKPCDAETKDITILNRLVSYPEFSVRYSAENINKAADRILAYVDVLGEAQMKQLIADFNTVRQHMDYAVSLHLLEGLSLEKNRRLQSMVAAVQNGTRTRNLPVGLAVYIEEREEARKSVNECGGKE